MAPISSATTELKTADSFQKASINQRDKKRRTNPDVSSSTKEERVRLVKKRVAHKKVSSQEPWGDFSFPKAEIEFLSKLQSDAERAYLSKNVIGQCAKVEKEAQKVIVFGISRP